jgi:hypothetical protein
MDVEANLLRDKHSMLCTTVSTMIEQLQASSSEDILQTTAGELVSQMIPSTTEYCQSKLSQSSQQYNILDDAPSLQDHFIASHGMLAVLEVLEAAPSRDVILNLLRVVNLVSCFGSTGGPDD